MVEYRVWECQICGWIYDEAKGWPEDGIAPGTRWEDIPEDWCCPECGAAKEDFEMVEVRRKKISEEASQAAPPETELTLPHTSARHSRTCVICGWTYDESRGLPEEGIAPGTRWETIPGDWYCPQCGADKADFEAASVAGIEAAKPATASVDNGREPLIIIGTGLAGYNLAREFRKLDKTTPLLLITGDDGTFYYKPRLSAALAHGKTPQQLVDASAEEMARELSADILVHTRVTRIEPQTRSLTLADVGSKLRYGKLVLATGASCRPLPPIDGDGLIRLFRVNSLADYHRFRTALVRRKRVLLLGAGLIGCEFANDLIQSGYRVDIVDPQAWPLATLLPEAAGRDLQRALEAAGARFHGCASVVRLDRRGGGVRAHLDNGEQLEADLALAALGLQANTGLALSAGLQVKRGITVNSRLQTSTDNIFALGDCAEVAGHHLCFVAPLVACARALARTLTGAPTPVRYGAIPVVVKTTLRPVTVCPPRPGTAGSWHIDSSENGVRAEFRGKDGRLLGYALTGEYTAMRDKLAAACVPLMED